MSTGPRSEWTAAENLPDSGIYVLVIHARGGTAVAVGALGELRLREGYYAYVGRAVKRLGARLARHARDQGKRRRWHIDYLLDAAELEEAWVFPLEAGECETAAALESGGGTRGGLRGFGAGDCRCPGHLVYLGREKPAPPRDAVRLIKALLRRTDGRRGRPA